MSELADRFGSLALAGKEGLNNVIEDRQKKGGLLGGLLQGIAHRRKSSEPRPVPIALPPPGASSANATPPPFPVPSNAGGTPPPNANGHAYNPNPGGFMQMPVPQHISQQSLTMQYALAPDAMPPPPAYTPPTQGISLGLGADAKIHHGAVSDSNLPRPSYPPQHSTNSKPPLPRPDSEPVQSPKKKRNTKPRPSVDAKPSRRRPRPSRASSETSFSESTESVSASNSDDAPSKGAKGSGTAATVKCSGRTKTGKQCSRTVKLGLGEEPDDDHYCGQHRNQILQPSGFYGRKNGQWVEFKDWIPEYLSEHTQAQLRIEMEKARSNSDVPGYIYTFEILDKSTPDLVHLKVGRAVSLNKRIDEWSKQCVSKEQALRGWWPGSLDQPNTSLLKGNVDPGPPGGWCHRLERLVHLELMDLAGNAPYLDAKFDNGKGKGKGKSKSKDDEEEGKKGKSGASTPLRVKKIEPHKCPDCGALHKEIFTFKRVERGRFKGKEWELLVKPVLEKWGAFVEAYV